MLEIFVALLCLCLVFFTPFIGIAVTLLTEKWLGLWAFVFGWAVPVMLVFGIYALYDIALRVTPCTPGDSLACGEPVASAFVFLVTWMCVILIANFFVQVALYLFLYVRRETEALRRAQPADETAPQ